MQPDEFEQMVIECRRAKSALGSSHEPVEEEVPAQSLRRGLWWVQDLPAKTRVKREHIKVARPCLGYPASHLEKLLGQILREPVAKETAIGEEFFSELE